MADYISVLAHVLVPRHSNDHKAKIIHPPTLLFIGLVLVVFQLFLQLLPLSGVRILGYAANISTDRVIELTNQKRAEAGLPPLNFDPQLSQAAFSKGDHMLKYDYWAHVAPDGTEPWIFFTNAGYKYKYAGENLARDFSNPDSAMDAWMASSSHRDNILSSKYTDIGIAVVEGDLAGVDTTIIVSLFGTRLAGSSDVLIAQAQTEATPTPAVTRAPSISSTPSPTVVDEENSQVGKVVIEDKEYQVVTSEGGLITQAGQQEASKMSVLVSPFNVTRGMSLITIITLLLVVVLDVVVVFKKKIPRVGARTLAHLLFFATILAILVISKAGTIL